MDSVTKRDRRILRGLAKRKVRSPEIAHYPVNEERRDAWIRLDSDDQPRPMVLAKIHCIQDTTKPVGPDTLQCEGKEARAFERHLRTAIYVF